MSTDQMASSFLNNYANRRSSPSSAFTRTTSARTVSNQPPSLSSNKKKSLSSKQLSTIIQVCAHLLKLHPAWELPVCLGAMRGRQATRKQCFPIWSAKQSELLFFFFIICIRPGGPVASTKAWFSEEFVSPNMSFFACAVDLHLFLRILWKVMTQRTWPSLEQVNALSTSLSTLQYVFPNIENGDADIKTVRWTHFRLDLLGTKLQEIKLVFLSRHSPNAKDP